MKIDCNDYILVISFFTEINAQSCYKASLHLVLINGRGSTMSGQKGCVCVYSGKAAWRELQLSNYTTDNGVVGGVDHQMGWFRSQIVRSSFRAICSQIL